MSSERPLITNPAKNILKNGGPVFGFNVFESLRPSVAKIAARTGYNMLLVENEHVLHNDETLTNFLVIAKDNGLSPAVTVLMPSRPIVSRVLDAGALGICLSHAETPRSGGRVSTLDEICTSGRARTGNGCQCRLCGSRMLPDTAKKRMRQHC